MPRLLPARTLAVHRKVSEDNLPDTLDVYKPTRTKASGGMVEQALGKKVATHRCRFVPTTEAREIAVADGVELDAEFAVIVSVHADVKPGYRCVVNGAAFQKTVDIVGTNNPRTDATLRHLFAVSPK